MKARFRFYVRWVCLFLIAIFFSIQVMHAAEEALVSGGESPDKNYRVVLISKDENDRYQPSAYFVYVPGRKVVGEHFVGSYVNFEGAKDPDNTKVIWSPDSHYAAITDRSTKRTGDITVYRVSRDGIQKTRIVDYFQRILKSLGGEQINRYAFARPIKWLSKTQLVIDVTGDYVAGSRDSGDRRAFHYEVCVLIPSGKIEWMKQIKSEKEEG